jgi:NhaA family Na+:H+ antiporter
LGKPVGVLVLCALAVGSGLCRLPSDLSWQEIAGAGILGGIGFTMSIFIANLAFLGDPATTNASKLAILLASLIAGSTGFLWLRFFGNPKQMDGQTVR